MSESKFINGKRGRSKAKVELSSSLLWGNVQFNVWETFRKPGKYPEKKITHSFYADKEFLLELRRQTDHALARLEQEEQEQRQRKFHEQQQPVSLLDASMSQPVPQENQS